MTSNQDVVTRKPDWLPPKRNCDACGNEYQPKRTNSKYCSDHCRQDMFKYSERQRIPDDVRWDVLSRDNFRCTYCGATPQDSELRVDHIVSIDDGGPPLDLRNLATSCHPCNSGKGDLSLDPEDPVVYDITHG